jgi:CDP-paratose 2-epimerase
MKQFGVVEWFRPGDHARVETLLPEMQRSGVTWLRTHLSWADYHTPGGQEWYDWLLPRLGQAFDLLPCVHYTPPSLSRTGKSSGAPRNLKDFADFTDEIMTRHGAHFRQIELWNEPNNLLDYDWRLDPGFDVFCEMIGMAAHWISARGWQPVLGGPCPFDPVWLDLMGQRGLLSYMHAVGLHGFPGTWDSEDSTWSGWDAHLSEMRKILDRYNPDSEIWITETGYSTWRNDHVEQARRFLEALEAPADRMYWYAWQDLQPDVAVQEGFWFDPRHYHLGVVTADHRPKFLARLIRAEDPAPLREIALMPTPALTGRVRPLVVTGGAGFIGSNLADSYLSEEREVIVFDNLSREGVEENLAWLRGRHGDRVHAAALDLRDMQGLTSCLRDAAAVFHLAGQTAVTTSLESPVEDFEVNARGTLNLLEGLRHCGRQVPLVFASTNKVYGALSGMAFSLGEDGFAPTDPAQMRGIDETQPLDFSTPYGCSKGVADQYVLDYAKTFGLPATVLRMSCIYGPRQFGTEDQGWVAHFLICALKGVPISIYGDGHQVRDICDVSDAVAAYRLTLQQFDKVTGRAFNLGGGPANAVSLRHVLAEISHLIHPPALEFCPWRAGDQPWFVADTSALQDAIGWTPKVGWKTGLSQLATWLAEERVPQTRLRFIA